MNAYYKGQPIFGPRGPAGPDGNPVGTVISYMGLTAPPDYLVCDGAAYNISDYRELAAFFQAQFGSTNHFGGDGVTTFAVPDMRNLFLRGYHGGAEKQLSGGVGECQEATRQVFVETDTDGSVVFGYPTSANTFPLDYDELQGLPGYFACKKYASKSDSTLRSTYYTARPVNMAVLFCVKAVESVPAENVYSTEEARIGTWIDGKPLYRRTLVGTSPGLSNGVVVWADLTQWNLDLVTRIYGSVHPTESSGYAVNSGVPGDWNIMACVHAGNLNVKIQRTNEQNKPMYITVEYTKTTD